MKKLISKSSGVTLKVGDRVSGHRIDKYHATIEKILPEIERVDICYNGDVKTCRVAASVCDAEFVKE